MQFCHIKHEGAYANYRLLVYWLVTDWKTCIWFLAGAFLFTDSSRPALGHTQWVSETLPRLNRQGVRLTTHLHLAPTLSPLPTLLGPVLHTGLQKCNLNIGLLACKRKCNGHSRGLLTTAGFVCPIFICLYTAAQPHRLSDRISGTLCETINCPDCGFLGCDAL